jgi:hypothetical protein
MDTTDIIRRIEKELGMSETYQVTTFEGIRENADGSWQEITLDLLDAGKEAGDRRYVAVLEFDDSERIIEGRTAPTVEEALSNVGAQLRKPDHPLARKVEAPRVRNVRLPKMPNSGSANSENTPPPTLGE